jgi:hypothetical protein
MARRKQELPARNIRFGNSLAIQELREIATELQSLREHPPLVQKEAGRYEGAILAFVRGLRLSARLIYFLRKFLSSSDLKVSWGHLLDETGNGCSRECDVVIHEKGFIQRWNGNAEPIMDFHFIKAQNVRAVVSCKSKLTSIDSDYPKALRKYGVKNVFLFAESCDEAKYSRFRKLAKSVGYRGVWCLYFTQEHGSKVEMDENMLFAFGEAVRKAVED